MSFISLSASFWGLAEVLDNESGSLFALSVGSLRRRHPLIASGCLSEDVCSVALPSGILQAAACPGNWGTLHFSTCLWDVNMWAWSRSDQEKPLMKGWWLISLSSKESLQAEYRLSLLPLSTIYNHVPLSHAPPAERGGRTTLSSLLWRLILSWKGLTCGLQVYCYSTERLPACSMHLA